jgi:hypothetical protein
VHFQHASETRTCEKRTPRHQSETLAGTDVLFLAVIASDNGGIDSPRYGCSSTRETLPRGIPRQRRAETTGPGSLAEGYR